MRFFSTLLLLGLLLGTATPAQALEWPTLTTPKTEPHWSIGVRFGPYRPRIAADPASEAKVWFDSYFNDGLKGSLFGHGPLLKQIEFEYYFTHIFGRIGAGLSVGHWDINAHSRRCYTGDVADEVYVDCSANPDLVTAGQTIEGNTPTSLVVIPFSLSAVYRADQLSKAFDIPLIPYAKVGADMAVWFLNSGGSTTNAEDAEGNPGNAEGLSYGWHFTLGLAVNLDWLDPTNNTNEDSVFGFAGSYIFVEGTYLGGDSFGASPQDRLDLSDFSGYIGLTLDFE